ncbi:hypothetical protein BGZ65_004704 [Modicella reniformis]|uniref:Brix domain-containing protein n=1 Tax=Modicella reniformis TaxID=1440133 RepID=A0A9P6SMK9_9FUNG|nr:hypothetical protein BGZ65_004704 [Modicella reniformis]
MQLSKAERKQLKKKQKEFAKKSEGTAGRPCFMLSRDHNKLSIKFTDIASHWEVRDLILYLLTETKTLPWIMVKNKFNIHKVVLLHVSGLGPELFHVNLHHPASNKPITWTEKATEGPVTEFQHLKSFFNVMNVMKIGGDKHRIFSPVEMFLSLPLSNSEKIQRRRKRGQVCISVLSVSSQPNHLTLDSFDS